MENEWETIAERIGFYGGIECSIAKTSRLRVYGGWLVKHWELGGTDDPIPLVMCFVPDENDDWDLT